jgi:hypothetical protein
VRHLSVRSLWVGLALLVSMLLVSQASPDAHAKVASFSAKKVGRQAAVFRIHGVRVRQVRSVYIVLGRHATKGRRAIRLALVRRAARRGTLRVKLVKAERARLRRARGRTAQVARRKRPHLVVSSDTTAPETTITSAPGATTASAGASFEFASNESGSTFHCRLDGVSWDSCSAPRAYASLAGGSHRFEARATDSAGNVDSSPASRDWTVQLDSTPAAGGSCQPAFGPFEVGSWPTGCWRPYADSSPFNRPVPANPRLLSNSSAIINRLVGWGKMQSLAAGHSGTDDDYWHPLYYSHSSDPLYTVRCAMWTSSCKVEGAQVRIPRQAQPAAGGDGHMAVIDQSTGMEYDFWQVKSRSPDGGTLNVSHGGKTLIDGAGLGSNATAAHFGLAAGAIRGAEVLRGEINHALFSQIKCSSGTSVYPAAPGSSGAPCSTFGLSNQDAPPMGARLWLALSDGEIDGLPVPAWKKTVLKAMAHYGVLVGDTMGGNSSWGIQAESGSSYTSFGAKDPWDTVGEQAKAPAWNTGYVFDVGSGVDWTRYLRVLDPCVSQGTC